MVSLSFGVPFGSPDSKDYSILLGLCWGTFNFGNLLSQEKNLNLFGLPFWVSTIKLKLAQFWLLGRRGKTPRRNTGNHLGSLLETFFLMGSYHLRGGLCKASVGSSAPKFPQTPGHRSCARHLQNCGSLLGLACFALNPKSSAQDYGMLGFILRPAIAWKSSFSGSHQRTLCMVYFPTSEQFPDMVASKTSGSHGLHNLP